jgi:hypothetical protein
LDLSFPRFESDEELTELPGDVAGLITGVAARQAASPTALAQARFGIAAFDQRLFQPLHGSFNAGMATALTRWKEE